MRTRSVCFRGVKQGDLLSPNIFNSILEYVFQKINWKGKRIRINGRYLDNLSFADDLVLIGKNLKEVQDMATQMKERSEEMELKMNIGKNEKNAQWGTRYTRSIY